MLRTKPWFLFFIVIFLLSACAQQASPEGAAQVERVVADSVSEFETGETYSAGYEQSEEGISITGGEASTDAVAQGQVQEQLIIRTGDIGIVVDDAEATIDDITSLAAEHGGYVVNSSVFKNEAEAVKTGEIRIRVPVETFDAVMNAIEAMALEVVNSSTTGQDVTEEYVDLSARLQNLEATADRVRDFLDEARTVEEALAVNAELSRLESEIESLKGRLQYLEESADYSTITVHIMPDELSQPLEVAGWRPVGAAREALEALIESLQAVATVVIWFVIFLLPLALVIGLPLWLGTNAVRRWRERGGGATPEAG